MPELDRRQVLAGAGALAVAPLVARRRRLGRARGPGQEGPAPPFEWGVASFDPTADSVLLWTRVTLAPGPVRLRWSVATDPDLRDEAVAGEVVVDGDTDHCAVVEVTGLRPATRWWYGFATADGEARSPVGRTATMPEGEAERLRIGVVSCARFASGGFAAYRALAEREVDLVVHLGDYVYEDGLSGARPHEPATRLRTLADYRARYAQHRTDPDLQALHARHPMVAVWDDHDLAGNAWRDGARDHDPTADGPWVDRLRAAGRARSEWVPGRTGWGDDGRLRAWRTLPLGASAELVVLDTRAWGRDRQPATPAEVGGPPPGGPAGAVRSLLGPDQAAEVVARLTRPDRPPWVLVANQVMLHPLRVPVPTSALASRIEAAGFLVVDGEALNPDQWDGYPQARDELLAAVGDRGGVVVLTGDVHSSWAWEGPATVDGEPAMVELVTPATSSEPLADRLPVPASVVETGLRAVDGDLSHVELSSRGYLIVDLAPDELVAEWWYVDPGDPVSERFGAGRRAPRAVPMRLHETTEPLDDPPPTTATTAAPTTPPTAASTDAGGDAGEVPLGAIGAGAGVVAAALGAALAVRRRRSGPG